MDICLINQIRQDGLWKPTKKEESYNTRTGEVFYTYYFKYQNLNFTLQTNSNDEVKQLYISGSLHYYFNNGLHNANDFTYVNLLYVLKDLKEKFGITPEQCILKSMEYGINIVPGDFQTRSILQNCFYFQRKKFTEPINRPYKQAGSLRENDYILKIYDKRFQFPEQTDQELLRVEIKYGRMRPLNKMGVVHLSDLLIKDNHLKLYKILQKCISEILYYDYTINPEKLSEVKLKNIKDYSNINFWENILIDIKKENKNRKNFDYHRKRLKNIISYGSDNIFNFLGQVIDNKKFNLLNLPDINVVKVRKVYPVYTHYKNQICTPYTQLYIGCIYPTLSTQNINITRGTSSLNFSNLKPKGESLSYLYFENITPIVEEIDSQPFRMIVPFEKEDSFIPDYYEFHNDLREIPF